MKIKLLNACAGPEGAWPAGSKIDLPDDQAQPLVDGGYAELLDAPATQEAVATTATPAVEQPVSEPETEKQPAKPPPAPAPKPRTK